MLVKVCKIMKTVDCAGRLINMLTTLRIIVFAGAFLYVSIMLISLLGQNIKNGV